jgi:tetratricopeptide (TPR) repeat protein
MNMMLEKSWKLLLTGLALSACASTGKVVVRTEPPDANVFLVDNKTGQNALLGKSPFTFDRDVAAKKGSEVIQLRFEKEGYEPKYSAVAAFGQQTTFLDVKLNSINVASGELRQAFELGRSLLTEANRLVLSKRYAEGLARVEKILEMDPKNSEAVAAKGSILYLMKDYDGAHQAWTKALELNPGYETVRASLVDLNLQDSMRRMPTSQGGN